MRLTDILRIAVEQGPDRLATRCGQHGLTFGELQSRSQALGRGLRSRAEPGDRIVIVTANRTELVECYYGVPAAGLTLVPLNYRLHPEELAALIRDCGATVLIAEPGFVAELAARRSELPTVRCIVVLGEHELADVTYDEVLGEGAGAPAAEPIGDEDDVAWIFYTSGTTGKPKGAALTHRNLLTSALGEALLWQPRPEDVFLFSFPMCHVGAYTLILHHLVGCPALAMPAFTAADFFDIVERDRVTTVSIAPTMLAMLLDHPEMERRDTSSIRLMVYGGSPIAEPVLRRAIDRFGDVFMQGFGMTECAGTLTFLDREAHRRGLAGEPHLLRSAGRRKPLVQVRVVDPSGRPLPPGEIGEITARGEQISLGYWTPSGLAVREEEWFSTGDVGHFDQEGFLYIVDRKKDLIISGGHNIWPREVEEALLTHPEIAEAVAFGVPDARWGETVAAAIRLRPGGSMTAEDVIAHCGARMAGFKKPRRILFVDHIPRNATGKVLRARLREQLVAVSR